jgi:ATP-dependent DNA ligase
MKTTTFPRLYHKGKSGAMIQWDISACGDTITTVHGQVGGKLQTASKKVEPKNTGRSNATTVTEQAIREAAAMHKNKLDRKYSLTPEEAQQVLFLPMLAHDFEKHKVGMVYPVFVQPKLDGFRCLAAKEDGAVTLNSRSGDVFDLPHISDELNKLLPEGSVVDGELYAHKVPFQKIASWIKKNHPETKTIGYLIYDVPEMGNRSDLTMEERVELLKVMRAHKWKNIDIVETVTAAHTAAVYDLERYFVKQGYEGAIVRTPGGRYQYGYRSHSLLKVKSFSDGEFRITGGERGVGKMADQCIFECVTADGNPFRVVPKGTAEERRAYLKKLKCYIGKQMTVKYFGLSEDGIPRFPVGIGVREDFDK